MCHFDFEDLLKRTIGLDPASVGSGTVERAVKSRMTSLGLQRTQSYWERLQTSADELQELIESVIVPETWFFRDREAYTVLVRLICKEWLPGNESSTLRVLSVPCCTGEEPYSLVMALLDAGLPCERIKVDAVDISAQAITKAKRGVYGSNSFRGGDLGFRDRYFDHSQRGYSLPKWLRDLVVFHQENIFSSNFRAGAAPYDVVFCRNVLIYFDLARQQQVMETLDRLLEPKGYPFVGPAEAFLAASSGFKAVNQTMSFAFRKERGGRIKGAGLVRPHPKETRQASRQKPLPLPLKAILPAKAVQAPIESRNLDLKDARRMADAGQLAEASGLCEDYLKKQGPSPEAYYLLGLMRDANGDMERATDCYRKVLYLEPDHPDALAHLALLCERQGDADAAKRLRDRARRAERSVKR